jgi:ubiquinone/menaquinone biosynthesis C-methylase UbiE
MGFYDEQILPRLTNVLLGNKEFAKVRRRAVEGLRGDVVEIGFGSGLNAPHYPPEVTGVWAVEPSAVAMRLAERHIAETKVPVHAAGLEGEALDLPDARFDAALSTMTLCTIPDVDAALREVHRVLKPGAVFHFAEHGAAPDIKVARTQDRFNSLQQKIAGGCNLNREIPALLKDAGFEVEQLENFYLKGPKAWGYMYVGRAQKPRRGAPA